MRIFLNCLSADCTAIQGEDFILALTPITFFPPTNESTTLGCTNITIMDDEVLESNHSFTVSLSMPSPLLCMLSQSVQTEIVIQDNEGKHFSCHILTISSSFYFLEEKYFGTILIYISHFVLLTKLLFLNFIFCLNCI